MMYIVYHIRNGTANIILYLRRNIEENYGLMSIFWTQKVKLFYAALLANNSHCSGVM